VEYQWRERANCPTSIGLSTTCNVSGIAQSGNFTVNFSNSAGNNDKSRSVTVQSGGGGAEYAACEKTPTVSTGFYPVTNGTTADIGELNDDSIMVIKFTVPSTAYGNPLPRTSARSTAETRRATTCCRLPRATSLGRMP
jgi:hypothetical protein